MEQILQYAWKYRLFNQSDLRTTDGHNFEILDVGIHNSDGGPDFFNAKIKYNDTVWAGNVEIHNNSSDWYLHSHHKDKKYDSVILNVVTNHDSEIYRTNGDKITQFIIDVPSKIINDYKFLSNESKSLIPCSMRLCEIPSIYVEDWKTSLVSERLNNKADHFRNLVDHFTGDWNAAFYVLFSRSFGTGINSDSFERLTRATPLNFLKRHIDSILQTEAILLGQAGLLDDDLQLAYYKILKREYSILKSKFSLKPIERSSWQFFRLRPTAFPHLRIAMLSAVLHKNTDIFSLITELKKEDMFENINKLFKITPNPYWENHYNFNENETTHSVSLGRQTINSIIINSIIPALYAYGEHYNMVRYKDLAFLLLEKIPYENNLYVRNFKNSGIEITNAYDSQALIQLFKEYCQKKKCMYCRFGAKLIGKC